MRFEVFTDLVMATGGRLRRKVASNETKLFSAEYQQGFSIFPISVPIIHYSCYITEAKGEVGIP